MQVYSTQPTIAAHTSVTSKRVITVDGLKFKDSNGDGKLQRYEDWRLEEICRAQDLVSRMSIPEKVGLMSETSSIGSGTADGSVSDSVQSTIVDGHVRQALIRLGRYSAQELATYLNNVQELCEAQPLGIPFVVTTDPSHGMGMSTNATTGALSLSESSVVSNWPLPLGLGAINSTDETHLYGDTVRREFMAMGFRWQLGPMADLATEPRWARVQNVFGSNAVAVAKHVEACIDGFQAVGNGGLRNGIAATMKHFPGAGPDQDGMDSHTAPGKYNVYPGDNFVYHQVSFLAAIDAGVAAAMPCYSIFKSQWAYDPLQVGAAFSREMITDYLKNDLGFTGMVTSDWGTMSSSPWGVEALTQPERAAMFLHAGSNQLGMDSSDLVQQAYDQKLITEDDINTAAAKILEMSFKLGIFENPYTDASKSADEARSADNRTAGFNAQKMAIVILRNRAHEVPPPSGFGRDSATQYLPIDPTRYTDTNSNGTADPGEYIDDTNGDGVISVYFNGVVNGLKSDPAHPDDVNNILGPYDYTSTGTGGVPSVVQADSLATADIAVIRIVSRKGVYFGLDAGVPLSFDGPFPGKQSDPTLAAAIQDRNKVIDALRVRDGYVDASGTAVPAQNPDLKIVLVMHMDRPGIVEPFMKGLNTLDENPGEPGSYPVVSDPANTRADGLGGVDAFLVEFGAFDRAVLDVLFNVNQPDGWVYGTARLPMEIPSSDAAVNAQFEDLPADSQDPTFGLGAGMTY